ncbi:MAG: TraB/GumN family protein, partial [Candidatus Omnitrophica bacterium]|nr:TraB/GumN family protein [Candidatus Omnitrophota bacterium]
MKKLLLTILLGLYICPWVSADIIELTNNRTVTGKVIEQTDEYVRLKTDSGISITFYTEEIVGVSINVTDRPAVEEVTINPPVQKESGRTLTLTTAVSPAPKNTNPSIKNFLWQVTSPNDPNKKAYLFGSIHFGKANMYPLNSVIENAFAESDVLAVEANVKDINMVRTAEQITEYGILSDDDHIKNYLKPKTYQRFQKQLEQFGMPDFTFSNFRPWMAAMTLVVLQIKDLGFEEKLGVDYYFLTKAEETGKAIAELESVEFQMQLFQTIDGDLFMQYTLDSIEETEKMLNTLIKAWKTGDTTSLEKVAITDVMKKSPETAHIMDKVLYNRNPGMVNKIKNYLETGQTHFVVVGAGHLLQERGIVELLR